MNKIKFISLSKSCSLNESASSTGEFGGRSFRDCDVVYGPDGTRYIPKDICALVDNAIEILDGLNYGLMRGYLISLPIVYTFSIPTMATDGSHIFINPGFVLELLRVCDNNPIGIAFVITHEIYHVLFKHHERRANRLTEFPDVRRANMAMDYEINWVIEHAYPMNDDDNPSENFDENGNRIQIFDGITKACSGLIDPRFKGMVWENIYDKIDDSMFPQEKEEDNKEVVYSKDFQDGFRDGCEKAIRELRAQGLVECSIENAYKGSFMLCEASQTVFQGTYNDGFEEGYKRTMAMVMGILNPTNNNNMQPSGVSSDISEAPIPNLPDITLKNPPANTPKQENNNNINVPSITNLSSNSSSQSKSSSSQSSSSDQQAQSNQASGQGGQGDQDKQMNQGGQSAQGGQGDQGDQSMQSAQGGQGGQGDQSMQSAQGGQGGQANPTSSNAQSPGNLTIVGISKGYSGKEKTTIGNHILSQDDGKKLADDAGYDDGSNSDTYVGKDNKFNDIEAVKATIRKLGQIIDNAAINIDGTIVGSTRSPGTGMMGEIGGIINKLYTPDVNWKQVLKRYLKGFNVKMEDIGYNKKYITYGRYNRLMDKEGKSAKRLLICVDTSNSVIGSGDYLRRIVANVAEIVTKLGIKYINVIQFADGVYRDTEFRGLTPPPADKFGIKVSTGGTNYDKVFEYIDSNYVDKKKRFQAVVFFTDMDVAYYMKYSPYFNKDIPKYSNKTVWMILTDSANPREEVGKKLFGKQIFVSQKDFDKNMNFIKDTNESFKSSCMNRRLSLMLNEGSPFKKIKKATPIETDDVTDTSADGQRKGIFARRMSALKARRLLKSNNIEIADHTSKNYEAISNWIHKTFGNNYNNVIFINGENEYKYYSKYRYRHQTVFYLNDATGCLNVIGDLVLLGDQALDLPNIVNFDVVDGNLIIGNCINVTSLPAGLPQVVSGNVTIFGMRNIKDLEGSPISVGNTFSVTACKKLVSLEGAPEKCGYFYSDKFTANDYHDYLVDAYGINENLHSKANTHLNEAFKSSKLTSLFNNPLNKEALKALKRINIMWSEIPDSIVNPIYNNVARSIQKRRDDNASGEFGIYIWCDASDKIYIIATGNNKFNRNINSDWSDGKGWLYVDPTLIDILNQRIEIINYANRYIYGMTSATYNKLNQQFNNSYDEARLYCKELGIKYDNKNIAKTAAKSTSAYGITIRDVTYYHLLMIPDLCCHAYLIQGTKDPRLSTDDTVAHFSYNNSKAIRTKLQESRANAIKDIIVQGRQLNQRDPAYKKYFEQYYLTDEKILEKFMTVRNCSSLAILIEDEIECVRKLRSEIRRDILNNFKPSDKDIDTIDLLYNRFNKMSISPFIDSAKKSLRAVKLVCKSKNQDAIKYLLTTLQNAYKDICLNKDKMVTAYNNNEIGIPGISKYFDKSQTDIGIEEINNFTIVWVACYTSIIQDCASLRVMLDKFKSGNVPSLEDLRDLFTQYMN